MTGNTGRQKGKGYATINERAKISRGIGFYQTHAPFLTGFPDAEERERHLEKVVKGLYHSSLLDALDDQVFTICYDVGHDQLAGNDPGETIRKLGNRIGCTHIHDNDGVHDLHTLPYYGVIDWEKVMQAFAEGGYTGNLNYEAARFVSKVPAALLPEGAKYMSAVGQHLIGRFQYYASIRGTVVVGGDCHVVEAQDTMFHFL